MQPIPAGEAPYQGNGGKAEIRGYRSSPMKMNHNAVRSKFEKKSGVSLFRLSFIALIVMAILLSGLSEEQAVEAGQPLLETPTPTQVVGTTTPQPSTPRPGINLPEGGQEIRLNLGATAEIALYFKEPYDGMFTIIPSIAEGRPIVEIVDVNPTDALAVEKTASNGLIVKKKTDREIGILKVRATDVGMTQINFKITGANRKDPIPSNPFNVTVEKIIAGLELTTPREQVYAEEKLDFALFLDRVFQPIKEGIIRIYFKGWGARPEHVECSTQATGRSDMLEPKLNPDDMIVTVSFRNLKPEPSDRKLTDRKLTLVKVQATVQSESPNIQEQIPKLAPQITVVTLNSAEGEPLIPHTDMSQMQPVSIAQKSAPSDAASQSLSETTSAASTEPLTREPAAAPPTIPASRAPAPFEETKDAAPGSQYSRVISSSPVSTPTNAPPSPATPSAYTSVLLDFIMVFFKSIVAIVLLGVIIFLMGVREFKI
jgi:hypothetical protein